jgi:Na+-driven multidrug efflux pump
MGKERDFTRRVASIDAKRVKEASWLTVGVCLFFVAFLALLLVPFLYFLTHYKS